MKKQRYPLVSVVMPVYNAGGFLVASIESILNQTYKNTEFIIVDDASTDESWEILKKYAKKYKKMKLFRNTRNLGISETAKRAISEAKGDFIARMDADDIALPNRLEQQIAYLQQHKKTVALGGQCMLIDKDGYVIGNKTFPTTFKKIYKYIFEFVPLQQPTMMIARKRLPKNFEYYRDGMNTAEEVELLFKLFQKGRVENLNNIVLMYRIHDENYSLKNPKETFLLTFLTRVKAIFCYGYRPTAQGLLTTIIQAFIVLLLPKKLIIYIYKVIRNKSIKNLTSFGPTYAQSKFPI